MSLLPAWLNNQAPVWTKRELLVLPDVMPGQYSLPMLLHNSEAGALVFADEAGNVLKYCEDQIHEAIDHRLVWIGQHTQNWGEDVDGEWVSKDWRAAIYVYSELSSDMTEEELPAEVQPSQPGEVLLLADYFSGAADDPHAGWERIFRPGEDEVKASNYVWVGPLPEAEVDVEYSGNENNQSQSHRQKQFDQALRIDPGIGRVALTRSHEAALLGTGGCLRLRTWFFDTLSLGPQAHWAGINCYRGSAALGLAADFSNCYAFINGSCPDGGPGCATDWQPTPIIRTRGWHFFELWLDSTSLKVVIDGEIVAEVPPAGASFEESIWLVARRGAVGHWAGLELMHTPSANQDVRFVSHSFQLGDRAPLTRIAEERGWWQVQDSSGKQMVHGAVAEHEENTAVAEPGEITTEASMIEDPPERPITSPNALTIECWSLPGQESEMARFERVMSTFVEHLEASGVTIPDNFNRVGRCGARQDPQPCYIYRFGTRRLHINLRETEGGRLCLVVRCGGGFLDFAEFARKNGNSEQMKLKRMQRQNQPQQGRTVLQVSSVLSNRKCNLRQMNSTNSVQFNSTQRSQN